MNELQREVKAMQDDLATGLNVMLISLGATDEKFLEFINGLTETMLVKEKR